MHIIIGLLRGQGSFLSREGNGRKTERLEKYAPNIEWQWFNETLHATLCRNNACCDRDHTAKYRYNTTNEGNHTIILNWCSSDDCQNHQLQRFLHPRVVALLDVHTDVHGHSRFSGAVDVNWSDNDTFICCATCSRLPVGLTVMNK